MSPDLVLVLIGVDEMKDHFLLSTLEQEGILVMIKRAGIVKYPGLEMFKDELYVNRCDIERTKIILKKFNRTHTSKDFTMKQKLIAAVVFMLVATLFIIFNFMGKLWIG